MIRLSFSRCHQLALPTLTKQSLRLIAIPPLREKGDGNDSITVLYKRNLNKNVLPRTSFIVSSLNSFYWFWYVFDFVPAVNESPIEAFHIDSTYAIGGLALSILIQSAFTLYPLSLIAEISYKQPKQENYEKCNDCRLQQVEILVWRHALPLVRPSSKPLIIPLGGITMDMTSDNTRTILDELDGNIEKFEGYLRLNRRVIDNDNKNHNGDDKAKTNFPLILEIREPSEVHNSQLLLQVLLFSGRIKPYFDNDFSEKGRSVVSGTALKSNDNAVRDHKSKLAAQSTKTMRRRQGKKGQRNKKHNGGRI